MKHVYYEVSFGKFNDLPEFDQRKLTICICFISYYESKSFDHLFILLSISILMRNSSSKPKLFNFIFLTKIRMNKLCAEVNHL